MRRLLLVFWILLSFACAGRRSRPGTPPSPPPAGAVQEGLASWYGLEEKGRTTASGEIMDPERFTAAHKSYPFGTVVRVDDLDTGRSVVVTINDRGPFVEGRIIDLSYASARALGIVQKGVARVRIHVIGEDNDDPTPFAWRVQVGAFTDEARAKNLAEALRQERYFPVLVHEQEQKGEALFKVWVGQFSYRRDADRLASQLRREGRSAVVISTKSDF
jgi:rare lipoprotein A